MRLYLICAVSILCLAITGNEISAEPNDTEAIGYAQSGKTEELAALIDKVLVKPDLKNSFSESLIYIAAKRGFADTVRMLAEKGANVNAMPHYPIVGAVVSRKPEIVSYLLSKGANINVVHSYYGSPLHAAIGNNDMPVFNILMQKKPDLELEKHSDGTPLMYAVSQKKRIWQGCCLMPEQASPKPTKTAPPC